MHLPSEEKLWQIPAFTAFPIPVPSPLLWLPLLVQATSYFAASVKISSFFISGSSCPIRISIRHTPNICSDIINIVHMFGFCKWFLSENAGRFYMPRRFSARAILISNCS